MDSIDISLWDHEAALAARDEAMARVESHSPHWRVFADLALRAVARRQDRLTSEDVWRELDRQGIPRPPEPRALGVVMRNGIRSELIRPDGWTTSTDPNSHADPMRTYRSLVR